MRENKTVIALRKIRVFNSWEFAGGVRGAIPYITFTKPFSVYPPMWQVVRPGYANTGDLDVPGRPLRDSHKEFSYYSGKGRKQAALEEAKSARYGIKEWARNPYGDWMDATFVKEHTKFLLELAAHEPDPETKA